jgi:hypothetical protein
MQGMGPVDSILDWGFTLFYLGIEEMQSHIKEQLLTRAVAVRVGNNADKKEWSSFVKRNS